MDNQHDELTATGVIRFQTAQDLATARFVSHFTRDLNAAESVDLLRWVGIALEEKVAS